MNDFERALQKFVEESEIIQKDEAHLQHKQKMFMEKWFSFMKEHGLPENFTLPALAMLAIRKSKPLIVAP